MDFVPVSSARVQTAAPVSHQAAIVPAQESVTARLGQTALAQPLDQPKPIQEHQLQKLQDSLLSQIEGLKQQIDELSVKNPKTAEEHKLLNDSKSALNASRNLLLQPFLAEMEKIKELGIREKKPERLQDLRNAYESNKQELEKMEEKLDKMGAQLQPVMPEPLPSRTEMRQNLDKMKVELGDKRHQQALLKAKDRTLSEDHELVKLNLKIPFLEKTLDVYKENVGPEVETPQLNQTATKTVKAQLAINVPNDKPKVNKSPLSFLRGIFKTTSDSVVKFFKQIKSEYSSETKKAQREAAVKQLTSIKVPEQKIIRDLLRLYGSNEKPGLLAQLSIARKNLASSGENQTQLNARIKEEIQGAKQTIEVGLKHAQNPEQKKQLQDAMEILNAMEEGSYIPKLTPNTQGLFNLLLEPAKTHEENISKNKKIGDYIRMNMQPMTPVIVAEVKVLLRECAIASLAGSNHLIPESTSAVPTSSRDIVAGLRKYIPELEGMTQESLFNVDFQAIQGYMNSAEGLAIENQYNEDSFEFSTGFFENELQALGEVFQLDASKLMDENQLNIRAYQNNTESEMQKAAKDAAELKKTEILKNKAPGDDLSIDDKKAISAAAKKAYSDVEKKAAEELATKIKGFVDPALKKISDNFSILNAGKDQENVTKARKEMDENLNLFLARVPKYAEQAIVKKYRNDQKILEKIIAKDQNLLKKFEEGSHIDNDGLTLNAKIPAGLTNEKKFEFLKNYYQDQLNKNHPMQTIMSLFINPSKIGSLTINLKKRMDLEEKMAKNALEPNYGIRL